MLTFSKAANTQKKKSLFVKTTQNAKKEEEEESARRRRRRALLQRERVEDVIKRGIVVLLFSLARLSLSLSLLDVIISMRGAKKKNEEVKTKPPCVFCCVPNVFSSSLSSLSSLSSS